MGNAVIDTKLIKKLDPLARHSRGKARSHRKTRHRRADSLVLPRDDSSEPE